MSRKDHTAHMVVGGDLSVKATFVGEYRSNPQDSLADPAQCSAVLRMAAEGFGPF